MKKILLLQYFFIFSFLLIFPRATFASWLDPSWQHRKPITIDNTQNSNTLTNYQVSVTLDTQSLISAGKMQAYCNDTRFTDSDGSTQLSYWLESGCNTTSTKIWVKVPSISASATKTIYVYYGNPSATSQSNGSTTFDFFSTFGSERFSSYINRLTDCYIGDPDTNDNCITNDNMNTITTTSTTYYTPPYGSYLYTGSTGFCGDAGLVATVTLPDAVGYVISFYARDSVAYWHSHTGVVIEKSGYGYGTKACDELSDGNYNSVYWLACSTGGATNGQPCTNKIDPETGTYYTPAFITTSWQKFEVNISRYKGTTFRLRNLAMDYNCDWCNMGDHQIRLWVDDVIIRKYTSPEPTTSVGGEEACSTPQSFNLYPGWNLISIPVKSLTSLASDHCGISSKLFYYLNTTTRKWEKLRWNQLSGGKGYWVYSDSDAICTFTYTSMTGSVTSSDKPALKQGYNLIGSVSSSPMNINSMYDSTCASKISVGPLYWNAQLQRWETASNIEPNRGYWVYLTSDC
jgi:hypothetical protein